MPAVMAASSVARAPVHLICTTRTAGAGSTTRCRQYTAGRHAEARADGDLFERTGRSRSRPSNLDPAVALMSRETAIELSAKSNDNSLALLKVKRDRPQVFVVNAAIAVRSASSGWASLMP